MINPYDDQAAGKQGSATYIVAEHLAGQGKGPRAARAYAASLYLSHRMEKGDHQAVHAQALGWLEQRLSDLVPRAFEAAWKDERPEGERGEYIYPIRQSGMLRVDARFADHLETLGPKGKEFAAKIRSASPQRWGTANVWSLWHEPQPTEQDVRYPLWIQALLGVVWSDAERSMPRALRVGTVALAGNDYAKVPKVVAPTSWAFGAPDTRCRPVELNGDKYVAQPPVSAQVLPRSYSLLPADHAKRPHQTSLAIDREGDGLPGSLTLATPLLITMQAAKLGLLFLASEQLRNGQLACSKLGELTRRINPGLKRVRSRDHITTARGLHELRKLHVYLPDKIKVQVFNVDIPWTPEDADPEQELRYGVTPNFQTVLRGGYQSIGRSYNGEYLVNLSGIMRLGNSQARPLRLYMRAAALWNTARAYPSDKFDAGKVPLQEADQWAIVANTLPQGVAEYLEARDGKGKATADRRRKLSRARKQIVTDLEELEGRGLVKLEKSGRRYRLLPTDAHLEAYAETRKAGLR